MKNLFLIFGILCLAVCSTAQYSYVYEIRHDNKPPIREQSESFDDMLQYRPTPSESSYEETSRKPEPKTRDFSVKSPEVGPTLLNMLRGQLSEKVTEAKDGGVWPTADSKQSPQIALQSNSNDLFPTYARQPLPKNLFGDSGSGRGSGSGGSSGSGNSHVNDLPVYVDKYQSNIVPKRYPVPETQTIREEPKIYEQRPVYKVSYPSSPPPPPHSSRSQERHQERYQERPQDNEEKIRTVHQIQTPNYRIQLVSQPESLEKVLPLIQQYQLNQKPFQSSQSPSSQSYPQSSSVQNLSPQPIRSSYEEPAKALVLDVEPDARISQPSRYTGSQIPESRPSVSHRPIPQSMYEIREREPQMPIRSQIVRSQPLRQYPNTIPSELKSEPRPILELPRQELPPQIQQLKGRPLQELPPQYEQLKGRPLQELPPQFEQLKGRPLQEFPPQFQQLKSRPLQKLPPPELRSHTPIPSDPTRLQRPSYPIQSDSVISQPRSNHELVPATALYQMSAPDLAKNMPSYSRVEYSPEEAIREGRREGTPTAYTEEPTAYRIVERPEKIDLRQQLERLGEDPSAQKSFFDRIKSQSVEMADRGRTKYRQIEEQSPLSTDPNYKPSPIPDEYKPFTQTRYYKTYI